MTKIAVIGVGMIGPRHAQTVIEDPTAQLVAIVDPRQPGKELADKLHVAHHSSVAELVKSEHKPDGAIICTPNHTHVAIGLELLDAGIHVLVEKPISSDVESGESLVQAARQSTAKVLVGHHRRFNSYILAAKRVVDSGRLGDLVAVNGMWTNHKPPAYFDAPAEWKRTKMGGVVLINLIHEVDLLQYLCGAITRVYAEPMAPRRGFDAEEGAAITFRFKSGAVGSFLVSDHTPSPHNFESGTGENPAIPKTGKDFYRLFGSNASLSVPDMTISSYNHSPAKSWMEEMTMETVPVHAEIPFQLQLAHFLRVIHGKEEPLCSGADGLSALVVCNAVKQSMETGLPVHVDG